MSLQTLSEGTALPTDFALGQNYPNPFNPSTIIPYQLPASGHVRLEVFNVLGQRLATLVDAERAAGAHTAQWDGTDASGRAMGAGVYIYRLSSGGMTESQRMVLVDGQAGIPAVAPRPGQSAVEETAATDFPVYGLTVSGEGLVAYVDPAFRVGVDEADIVLEEHGGSRRMKLTTDRILGDVNNDGQVDAFDAQYVLLYSEDSSITLPNNGDISFGDVNGDGQVDLADAVLLATYSVNPSDPTLPPGIGQAASVTSVSLEIALSHIYWTDASRGTIHRANLDGSSVETLITGADAPNRLALDVDGGHIYWTDWERSTIHRANLDGSNVETLISWADSPRGLALDIARGHIYWMEWDTSGTFWEGTIRRANLDGSNVEILPIDVDTPLDLVLDVARGHIYWTGTGIHRANLNGSSVETLATEMTTPLYITSGDLALDVDGSQMYWTDLALGTLHRANLDGSNIETLDTGVGHPYRLALDTAGGHIYWTASATLHRANLDSSNVESLISGVSSLYSMALDMARGHIYWTERTQDAGTKIIIQRANLDGSNIETLVSGVYCPGGVCYHTSALAVAGSYIYWTEETKDGKGIHRANLDGSNIETLIEPSFPYGIALGP